jgi:uncharacterized protein YycO
MIQLRFTRNKGIVSRIIRAATWSQYSHVEFMLDNGYLGALGKGGVLLRSFDYAPEDEFVYRGIDCTPTQQLKVEAFAAKQIGKPYDWGAVFGVALHRDWHQADHWFCSELIMASLEAGGLYFLRDKVNRVTPEMLFELEEVHE